MASGAPPGCPARSRAPRRHPAASARRTRAAGQRWSRNAMAESAPSSPACAPTERSIWPATITSTMPIARMAVIDIWRASSERLRGVRNVPSVSDERTPPRSPAARRPSGAARATVWRARADWSSGTLRSCHAPSPRYHAARARRLPPPRARACGLGSAPARRCAEAQHLRQLGRNEDHGQRPARPAAR